MTWGLGWQMFDWPGGRVIATTAGRSDSAPFSGSSPRGVAVALLTNGGRVLSPYQDVVGYILGALAGVTVPEHPVPPAAPHRVDATSYLGTYASRILENTVSQDADGRVWVHQKPKDLAVELGLSPLRYELVQLRDDTLIATEPDEGIYLPHTFVGDDCTGSTQYLHTGRVDRRVAP
jgi:hypothetical protein